MGPIAILVIQVSLSKGHKAGFLTGLGATLIDTIYAVIAIFALAFTEKFISDNSLVILLAGGIIVAFIGFRMTFSNPFRKMKEDSGSSYSLKDFMKAVAMGISNPGAILAIFALFAFFNISVEEHNFMIAPLIMSLSAGSVAYWLGISWMFSHIRKSFKLSTILWINRISGAIITIIGIALIADGLMKCVFG